MGSTRPAWVWGILISLLLPAASWGWRSTEEAGLDSGGVMHRAAETGPLLAMGLLACMGCAGVAWIARGRKAVPSDPAPENLLEEILRTLPLMVYSCDAGNGQILYLGGATQEISGYTAEEHLRDPGLSARIMHPEDRDKALAAYEAGLRSQQPFELEFRIIHRAGQAVWIRTRMAPVRDDGGTVVRYTGASSAITRYKETETQLEAERSLLNSILELNPYSMVITDREGRHLRSNPACRDMFKVTPPANYSVFDDPVVARAGLTPRFQEVREGRVIRLPELWYDTAELSPTEPVHSMCLRCTVFPIMDAAQRFCNAVMMHEDVTAQKLAEERLHRRQTILEAVAQAAQQFLEARTWEQCLPGVLEGIGGAVGASRSYLFRQTSDAQIEMLCHWAKSEQFGPDEVDTHRHACISAPFARWNKMLRRGEIIHDGATPFDAEEQAALDARRVRSVVQIPIFINEQWWGFLGFDDCEKRRDWSEGEIDVLRTLAGMLGSAIQRDLSQRALEEATQQLESRVVVRTAELAALNQALQQEINERRQAETTLRRQAQIIDQVADTVFCTDLDNRVVFWNRGAERLTGYTTEEATGRPISFLYLPEDYVSLQNCIHLLTQSGQHEYETRILRKDGSLRHAWISLSLLHDEAGATTGMSGYAVDITGQKRTQEALQESEGRLRAFVDAMPDVAFILDEDGRYIEVLAHDDTLLYDTKTKLQGKLLHEVFPADDADRYVAVIRRTLETGLSQSHDYEIRVGAGNLWFEARTAPIVGASASKRCVVWVARDVTPRKLALEELRSAHEQLRATLNALPDLLFEVDRDLRIRDYRAPDSTRLFAPPDAFLGRRIAEVLPPEAAEIVLGACEKAFQHGRHMGAVYSLPMPTGVQWYQLSISIKGEAGSTDARLIAMARDITEVKQAERAMQASEQRYRLLAETAQDFIFIIDREDRVAYANTYAGRQFKCSPEQLVGRKRSELFPSPGMGHQQENLRAVFTSGRTISVEHPTPFPDETLWLHTRLVPLPDERGEVTAVLGISRDMTEHRRAAAALSASEEKYRTLVESLDVGILQSTLLPEPRFTHANIACARILGYASVEALMACSPTSIYVDAADRDVYLSVLRRQGAVRNHELRIRRPDGSEAMVSITATVRFNTQGEMMLLDGVVEDVTERRKAEDYLRLLSAAVEQSAAGIAVADPRGMVLFVNEAFAAMHGLSREATPGKHLSIFHLPEQMEQVYAANDDVLHAGRFRGVVWHARRGGRAFPALMNVSPLHDAGGRMAGFIASALDISDQVQAEAQRERLSRAVENAGEGIGTFDDSWALTYANPALARIFAAPLPALLGRSWQELFELPDGAGFQEMANALRHQERWAGRLLGKSTDGRSLPLSMTLVRMAQPEGGELIVANIRDQSEEAMHLLQIRKLTLEAAASLENERARLSRELHDELGQMLTAINLNLAWLSARGAAWEDVARQRLMETQQLVNQLLDAVRTLSTNLRPPILDNRGLLEAIRSYAGGFARRAGFTCRIHAAPADLEVRDPLATTVFRIIQEALTNVARHSRASKCGIFLKFSGAHLEVKIRDNGVGAVASRLDGVQSLGIAGMRERAKAAGGMLKVENRVEGGVCVVAQLPWNQ